MWKRFALIALMGMALIGVAVGGARVATAQDGGSLTNAQMVPGVSSMLRNFEKTAQGWEETLRKLATNVFWMLATIQLVWSAAQLAMKGADLSEWLSELFALIMFIGFGLALLKFSSTWASAIIESFQQAANKAQGANTDLAPSDVFSSGVRLAVNILANWSFFKLFNAVALAFSALIIVFCYAMIAAMEAIVLVESYIVISASVLFMGFSGSRWTKDYALKIMTYAVSVGAKLFVMQLIIALCQQLTRNWSVTFGSDLSDIFIVVGSAIMLVALAKAIPDMVQSLINGVTPGAGGQALWGATVAVWAGTKQAIGAGRAVEAAGALASEQLQDPKYNTGQIGDGWFGRTVRNLGGAAARNIGHRVGGRGRGRVHTGQGTPGGQMADDLNSMAAAQRRKNQNAASNPTGGNTIQGGGP